LTASPIPEDGANMATATDPFVHHPELRDLIDEPENCFFRTFTTTKLAEMAREKGIPQWWYSDEEREAMRAKALAKHGGGDLWVFAYGSLMWDPGLYFEEVRRAWLPDHARRLILKDIYGARGTAEAPGLMAALDGVATAATVWHSGSRRLKSRQKLRHFGAEKESDRPIGLSSLKSGSAMQRLPRSPSPRTMKPI
jgi:hypothetical protein